MLKIWLYLLKLSNICVIIPFVQELICIKSEKMMIYDVLAIDWYRSKKHTDNISQEKDPWFSSVQNIITKTNYGIFMGFSRVLVRFMYTLIFEEIGATLTAKNGINCIPITTLVLTLCFKGFIKILFWRWLPRPH